jgi:hypothetical protein
MGKDSATRATRITSVSQPKSKPLFAMKVERFSPFRAMTMSMSSSTASSIYLECTARSGALSTSALSPIGWASAWAIPTRWRSFTPKRRESSSSSAKKQVARSWDDAPSCGNPILINPKSQRLAKSKPARVEALQRLKQFVEAYREALALWLSGDRSALFPFGTYRMSVLHAVNCAGPP